MSVDAAIDEAKLINSMGNDAYICERRNGELAVLIYQTLNYWSNRDARVLEIFKVTERFQ